MSLCGLCVELCVLCVVWCGVVLRCVALRCVALRCVVCVCVCLCFFMWGGGGGREGLGFRESLAPSLCAACKRCDA